MSTTDVMADPLVERVLGLIRHVQATRGRKEAERVIAWLEAIDWSTVRTEHVPAMLGDFARAGR